RYGNRRENERFIYADKKGRARMNIFLASGFILLTIVVYYLALRVHRRYQKSFTIPSILATLFLMALFYFSKIPYDTYMIGGGVINHFLSTAIVALGYQLYEHRALMKQWLIPLGLGTFMSTVFTVALASIAVKTFHFAQGVFHSLIIKSITMPIALELTHYVKSDLVLTILL